jgi:hypothetical protein
VSAREPRVYPAGVKRSRINVEGYLMTSRWHFVGGWLEELDYKDDWVFNLYLSAELDVPMLAIQFWSLDSTAWRRTRPGDHVATTWSKVGRSWALTPYATHSKSDFQRFLQHCIIELECHEANEWLQDLSGRALFDPHTGST